MPPNGINLTEGSQGGFPLARGRAALGDAHRRNCYRPNSCGFAYAKAIAQRICPEAEMIDQPAFMPGHKIGHRSRPRGGGNTISADIES